MRRLAIMSVVLVLLILLAACEAAPGETISGNPESSSPAPTVTAADEPVDSGIPATADVSATPEPSEPPEDWRGIFGTFLKEEYEKLLEAFVSGMAGLGFIDLDVDGSPELIVFDSGAATSLGVQIFDIIDGDVECVSANTELVKEMFGGGHVSDAYISANEFSAFRLMRTVDTGELTFVAYSGSGGIDFLYTEIIKIGKGGDGEVTVSEFLARHEEYEESGSEGRIVSEQRFAYMGESVDAARYDSLLAGFEAEFQDTGYEAQGAFLWENAAYEKEYEGFFAMFDAAVKAYVPISE